MPLEGKKIHESMKSELLTFPKDQNRIRNAKYMLQTMEI
jgi:hypothetical protein